MQALFCMATHGLLNCLKDTKEKDLLGLIEIYMDGVR
jgi:hypothetical protein